MCKELKTLKHTMEDLDKEFKNSKIVIKPSKMIISSAASISSWQLRSFNTSIRERTTPDIRNSFSTLMLQLLWARDRARKVTATCPSKKLCMQTTNTLIFPQMFPCCLCSSSTHCFCFRINWGEWYQLNQQIQTQTQNLFS